MSIDVDFGRGRIKTTIATDQKQVDEGVQALMSNSRNRKRLIGLDTIPIRSASRKPSIAVLQLCDESQCLIVRLTSFYSIPESLYNFLSLPGFTFVGFAIKDAMATLRKKYGFVCKNALEAGPAEWSSSQIPSATNVLMNMHIPPTQCISDIWDAKDDLTEDLVKLAVSNAHAAFRIGGKLLNYPYDSSL